MERGWSPGPCWCASIAALAGACCPALPWPRAASGWINGLRFCAACSPPRFASVSLPALPARPAHFPAFHPFQSFPPFPLSARPLPVPRCRAPRHSRTSQTLLPFHSPFSHSPFRRKRALHLVWLLCLVTYLPASSWPARWHWHPASLPRTGNPRIIFPRCSPPPARPHSCTFLDPEPNPRPLYLSSFFAVLHLFFIRQFGTARYGDLTNVCCFFLLPGATSLTTIPAAISCLLSLLDTSPLPIPRNHQLPPPPGPDLHSLIFVPISTVSCHPIFDILLPRAPNTLDSHAALS